MTLHNTYVYTNVEERIRLSSLDLYCKTRRLLQHFQNSFFLKLINDLSKGMVQRILQVTSVNQLRCLIFTDTDRFVIVWTHKFKKRKVKKHLLVELNRWTNKSSGKPILIGVDAVLCQEYKHRMGDHNLSWKKCCMSLERWG